MNRIFYIALLSILLSGCPATYYGLVKNESGHTIVVVPPFETEFHWVIEPGSQKKVNWYQECITIKGPNGIQYFVGWPVSDNVVSNGIFSSSLEAVYKSNQLFFKTQKGLLIKLNEVVSCAKA